MFDYERALKYLIGTAKFDPVYAAMNAVEKQIPVVVVKGDNSDICPSCSREISKEFISVYKINHCPYCGQALKQSRG